MDEHLNENNDKCAADVTLNTEYRFTNYGYHLDASLSCELDPGRVIVIGEVGDKAYVSMIDNIGNNVIVEDFPKEQLFKLAKGLIQLIRILGDPYKRPGDINVSGI